MPLQPPLLVPSGDAENGERIIEAISYHLKRCARPSAAFCREIAAIGGGDAGGAAAADGTATDLIRELSHGTHTSYQSRSSHGTFNNGNNISNGSVKPIPTPNCCIIPCIDELILDLERLVTLRDEIVYSFETDLDGGGDAESAPDVVTLLREYCALLGALLTVPGLGSLPSSDDDNDDNEGGGTGNNMVVHVGGLFLTWHKIDEDENDGTTSAMDIDTENSKIEVVESHFSVSSLYHERQLSTYLLACLEYQNASTNLNVSSSPANAAHVLSDMAGARDALKAALLGFGRVAALFDHLRTVIENDLQEDGAIGTCAGTGTGTGSSPHMAGSDTTTRHSGGGSEVGESSIPMILIAPCYLLDPSALHSFHLSSMALGQSCFYYTALMQRKQMHTVLAKLAAGCAEKYEAAATFARRMSEDDDSSGVGEILHGKHTCNIRSYMPSKALIRSTFATGEYYYFALAEYHQACIAHTKTLLGVEVARFSSAIHLIGKAETELLGSYHNELMNTCSGGLSSESEERIAALLIATATTRTDARLVVGLKSVLCAKVINLHAEITRLMAKAEEAWADDVPTDIPPTRSQAMMKMEAIPMEANFLDPALGISYLAASPPLQQLLDSTGIGACTDFHRKLFEMFTSAKLSARNATNTAKDELAKMGLPDSISTFKATVEAAKSGRSNKVRGIPSAMAEQIESLQSNHGVLLLKQNLYILEEVATLARKTLDETEEMLNETVRADHEFRRQHPTFAGRDVATEHEQIAVSSLDGSGAVETNARQICSKIRAWLDQANEGDQKLCQVLEEIETDPKYRLVMLPLDQLEKLVRGGSGRMNEDETHEEERTSSSASAAGTSSVETLALEKQLEHLGTLIASRRRILDGMESDVLAFNQRERAVQAISNRGHLAVADSQFYEALTVLALPLFDHHIEKVNNSIQKQTKIFRLLLQLYSKFQLDRSVYEQQKEATKEDRTAGSASSPAKAYLDKIASALKTVEWCRPQLVQGRDFYQTVLANIEELKKKVEDVNAVLASERIFFEDSHSSQRHQEQRRRQEEEDERLARELMREAEEAAAQNAPQAQMDPRQQEEDERLARELAQQFQEEANISSRNPTDLVDNRDVTMGDANARPTAELTNVVNALGLADGGNRPIGIRNPDNGRQRSSSLDHLDENARHEPPPPNVPRRSSSFADLGDIPAEIFVPIDRSSGSERISMASLGGVSSIGSESIVRNFHRQQQLQLRQQQQQVGDSGVGQTTEGGDGGDNDDDENMDEPMEENLAGIPVPRASRRPQNEADEEMVAPAPPSPLGAARAQSTLSSGGISRSSAVISRSGLPGRSSRPGIINVRNDEVPQFDVNDEAFAQLLAMDFSPELVRDALSRYDNVERATEWILQNL